MSIIKRRLRLITSTLLLLSFGHGYALGVSDIQLKSSLNQKLDADIELKSATPDELDNLTVSIRLLDDSTYDLPQLKYEVQRSESANILNITSSQVIKEPILHFQLELDWQTGQLLRDYALLIDPPGK